MNVHVAQEGPVTRGRADDGIAKGDQLLVVDNISLAFGGVKAITDISFNVKKGEIRAIIGPNGAGKTSMLNVINGFYHPQEGVITFRGQARSRMQPYEAAAHGGHFVGDNRPQEASHAVGLQAFTRRDE